MARNDYNERRLRRRMEVLQHPVTTLQVHGYLTPSDHDVEWNRQPCAVGVGPDGLALAVWEGGEGSDRMLVTRHDAGRCIVAATVVTGAVKPRFVQPLPGNRLLLARARSGRGGEPGAQVWTADGDLVAAADLGDAIEHLLTTPDGAIWAGYFDEAMSGSGPQVHGLARFSADLAVDWVYPQHPYPVIFDCYALNVVGEAAYTCAYTAFQVVSVHGSRVTDHGASPHRGSANVLVHGRDGVFVGGYGAEYDQVTPIRFAHDGVVIAGKPRRLVLPDGMEIRNVRYTCRGPDLHAIIGNVWYRCTIDNLSVEPAQAPAT